MVMVQVIMNIGVMLNFALTAPSMLRPRPVGGSRSLWKYQHSQRRAQPSALRHQSSLSPFRSFSSGRRLTHVDEDGQPSMVDVSEKQPTKRTAMASGRIYMPLAAYELVIPAHTSGSDRDLSSPLEHAKAKALSKGDVLIVARLAGIMGCKRTSELIPLCHPLLLTHVDVALAPEILADAPLERRYSVHCRARVSCTGETGVEMEALTAVATALLTVWDMLKAIAGREMAIGDIKVNHKAGGRTGEFTRDS